MSTNFCSCCSSNFLQYQIGFFIAILFIFFNCGALGEIYNVTLRFSDYCFFSCFCSYSTCKVSIFFIILLNDFRSYYYMPYMEEKPCTYLTCKWSDGCDRLRRANVIHRIADELVSWNFNYIFFYQVYSARKQQKDLSVFESSRRLPTCLPHTVKASHCHIFFY